MTEFINENEANFPIWDKESFIKRLMGDEALADKLLNRYLSIINEELESLTQAISESNSHDALHIAHKIHGSSNSVGATRIGYTASLIEAMSKVDDLSSTPTLLQKMTHEVAEFKNYIDAI